MNHDTNAPHSSAFHGRILRIDSHLNRTLKRSQNPLAAARSSSFVGRCGSLGTWICCRYLDTDAVMESGSASGPGILLESVGFCLWFFSWDMAGFFSASWGLEIWCFRRARDTDGRPWPCKFLLHIKLTAVLEPKYVLSVGAGGIFVCRSCSVLRSGVYAVLRQLPATLDNANVLLPS